MDKADWCLWFFFFFGARILDQRDSEETGKQANSKVIEEK